MLEVKTLAESTQVELALPDSGFSKIFIDSLFNICLKYESLHEGYLVLKKQEEEVSLLFGLLFFDKARPLRIEYGVRGWGRTKPSN